MTSYQLDIIVKGHDRASGPIRGVGSSISRLGRLISGVLLAGLVYRFARQIGNLAGSVVGAYTEFERMQISVQNLVAREMARGILVEEQSKTYRELTEAERLELDKLLLTRHELLAEIDEQTNKYNEVAEAEGAASFEALAQSIALRELQVELGETNKEIGKLEALNGVWLTTMKESRTGMIEMSEALGLAVEPAKQISRWIERLAVFSPFKEEDVLTAFRTVAAYGFVVNYAADAADETERLQRAQEDGVVTAQRLTSALIDLVAGTGLPSEYIRNIAIALGQVQAKGKLAAQEIYQLVNAGIGVELMAYAMGLTVDEFEALREEGEILAEDFVPALVELIERDFQGSAERLMMTLGGTLDAIRGIVRVLLRDFFTPSFQAILPTLRDIFELLAADETRAAVQQAGRDFADAMSIAAQSTLDFLEHFQKAVDLAREFDDVTKFENIRAFFETLSPDQVLGDVSNVFDRIEEFMSGDYGFQAGNAEALSGALEGIGTVLGSTIFLKGLQIGAGLLLWFFGKINFVTLGISLAVGALKAIWDGDWLGIRTTITEFWDEAKPKLEEFGTWLREDAVNDLETFVTKWKARLENEWHEAYKTFHDDLDEGKSELEAYLDVAGKSGQKGLLSLAGFMGEVGAKAGETFSRVDLWFKSVTDSDSTIGRVAASFGDIASGFGQIAASSISIPPASDFLDSFKTFIDTASGPGLGAFQQLAGIAWDDISRLGSDMYDTFQNLLLPTFETVTTIWDENVAPIIAGITEGFTNIKEFARDELKFAFDEFVMPVIDTFWTFGDEHVMPLLTSINDLFWEMHRVLKEVFEALWNSVVLPVWEDIYSWLYDKINPAVEKWVDFTQGLKDKWEDLKPVLIALRDFVFAPFAEGLERIGTAMDNLRGFIEDVKEALADFHVPDDLLHHSPSPFELSLMGINEGMMTFNRLSRQSPLFRGGNTSGGFGFGGSPLSRSGSVVIEGDTNTFIVDSDERAKLVAAMINQKKRERLDALMGVR